MNRRSVWMIMICLLAFAFSGCRHDADSSRYVGRCIVGAASANSLGIPEASGSYQEYLIYPDKTYLLVTHTLLDDGTYQTEYSERTRVSEWKALKPILSERVLMNEGDVAVLSADQFVAYLEAAYP